MRLLFDLTYGVPQGTIGEKVGDAMRRYWARFAATGDPNAPGSAHWPRYESTRPRSLDLGDPIGAAIPDAASCEVFENLWDEQYPMPPARN